MAVAFLEDWGGRVESGCVLTPEQAPAVSKLSRFNRVRVLPVDHPLPTARNVRAARAVRVFAEEVGRRAAAGERAALVVLLSGGASAHLTLPRAGVRLADVRAVTRRLMTSGAGISALNAVRSALDELKAGGLWRAASPATVVTLAISDVVGAGVDEAGVIGSGPTTPRRGLADEARKVMTAFDAWGVSERVDACLRGAVDCQARAIGVRAYRIVAGNRDAVRSVATALREEGIVASASSRPMVGNVEDVAARVAAWVRRARRKIGAGQRGERRPRALVLGGETTVRLSQRPGLGGRNQELVLRAAMLLREVPGWALIGLGTDGVDGPTDAAGASVDDRLLATALRSGVDVEGGLARHDTHRVLERMERSPGVGRCLIRTGPTGTNVADILVAVVRSVRSGRERVH